MHNGSRRALSNALSIVGNGVSLAFGAGRDGDEEVAETQVGESCGGGEVESVVDESSRKKELSTANQESAETEDVVSVAGDRGEGVRGEFAERSERVILEVVSHNLLGLTAPGDETDDHGVDLSVGGCCNFKRDSSSHRSNSYNLDLEGRWASLSSESTELKAIEEGDRISCHELAVSVRKHHIDFFVAGTSCQRCCVDHETRGFVVVVVLGKDSHFEHLPLRVLPLGADHEG